MGKLIDEDGLLPHFENHKNGTAVNSHLCSDTTVCKFGSLIYNECTWNDLSICTWTTESQSFINGDHHGIMGDCENGNFGGWSLFHEIEDDLFIGFTKESLKSIEILINYVRPFCMVG